jgi:hypothetical protein
MINLEILQIHIENIYLSQCRINLSIEIIRIEFVGQSGRSNEFECCISAGIFESIFHLHIWHDEFIAIYDIFYGNIIYGGKYLGTESDTENENKKSSYCAKGKF